MKTNIHTNIAARALSLGREVARDLRHLVPLTAFTLVNLLPGQALVYSQSALAVLVFPANDEIFDAPSATSYPFKPGAVLGVISTAYSSTVAQTDSDPFTTASGTRVRPGIVAANFLPLGTRLRLGAHTYTVEDRMNARYNDTYRIDIWMESTQEARTWGMRPQIIEIVSLPTR